MEVATKASGSGKPMRQDQGSCKKPKFHRAFLAVTSKALVAAAIPPYVTKKYISDPVRPVANHVGTRGVVFRRGQTEADTELETTILSVPTPQELERLVQEADTKAAELKEKSGFSAADVAAVSSSRPAARMGASTAAMPSPHHPQVCRPYPPKRHNNDHSSLTPPTHLPTIYSSTPGRLSATGLHGRTWSTRMRTLACLHER